MFRAPLFEEKKERSYVVKYASVNFKPRSFSI